MHSLPPPADPENYNLWHGDLGIKQVRRSRRGYYGSVSFIDEQIGRILSSLKKCGYLDNTFILFTSDHGDMTGDHHMWRKTYAYESSARIPFIVRPPSWMGVRQTQRITQVVEHRDILPTFLDVAGQSVPEHLDGRSVLELLRGKTNNWREIIDMEHDVCYDPSNHWNALTDRRYKYIYHAQKGRTPLLILHGKKDTRVHPSQSMELYRYLKTLGNVPVRLIFYPDESHGTSKAAARYDISLRKLRWLEHYLTGPGGEPPPLEVDYSGLKPGKKVSTKTQ